MATHEIEWNGRRFISARTVMQALQLGRSAAYELMGALGAVRVGRAKRLPLARFNAYLRSLESGTGVVRDAATLEAEPASAVVELRSATKTDRAPHELSPNLARLERLAERVRKQRRRGEAKRT